MPKSKDPMLEALRAGRSYTWTLPDGGDLASMRAAVKHGQTLTLSPVLDRNEIRAGDIVLVKWQQGTLLHLVGEIQGDQFLIVNSVGKVNGWVNSSAILGRVTEIIEPEPRPSVPVMLEQLEIACHELIEQEQTAEDDARRLLSVVDDLWWYAGRIGSARWDQMPRSNKWSFEQQLWHLVRQTQNTPIATPPAAHRKLIDRGHECAGMAAEIIRLLE